jgi:ATP-binding protein involved in chromosome partitioning
VTDPATTPEALDLKDSTRRLVVTWGDGKKTDLPYREVRLACRCAACIDERTGRPILDPKTVPEDVGVSDVEEVGHYGVRFDWTDGHGSGIYTWERLRSLGAS